HGHLGGNGREIHEFTQGQFNNQVINKGNALNVPVDRVLLDQHHIFGMVQHHLAVEILGKLVVFIILEHRQQSLALVAFLTESFKGLQDHAYHKIQVVIPVNTLFFQQGFNIFVVKDQVFKNILDQFFILHIG